MVKLIGERLLERKFGEVMSFVPNRGDVVWLEFSPHAQWICSLPVTTVAEVFRNLAKLCQ
jgi:hypothetical protein